MKMLKFLLIIICCIMLSCSQENDFFFPEEKRSMNIWVGTPSVVADSITHNFAFVIPGRDSIVFNYRLSGYPLDHDTEFELQPLSGDTNRVYYYFNKYIVKAGEYQGQGVIYIDKPADYTEFQNSTGKIVFKLKESDVYKEGAKERSSMTVLFKNFIAKPDNWDVAITPYRPLATYFGTYSAMKYAFIIQTTGMSNFKVQNATTIDPSLENTITVLKATYFQNLCKIALENYVALNGPLLDENKNTVFFP